MPYLGSWAIDNLLTFPAITHRFDTGALTDADAVPAYRIYEDETGTAILTGNMAKLDDANTTGFYSEQITLSAANGFEKGKCYTIYITAAVNSVTGGQHHTFQMEAEVDANTVSGGVNVTQWLGTAAATPTVAGVPEVDVTHFGGSAATASDGRPEVNTTHAAGTAWGSGAITAATVATGAIDADALATDAVVEIRALASGTSDSGTTTTMVDAARTEADTDYWKGSVIVFTSGTLLGQARLITGFTPGTDTITFSPATTQAVSTHTYEIWPAGRIDTAELAAAVWDEDATGHQTQGTFGQAIGDPGADTDTIWALANTNLNATVGSRASQTSVDTIDDFLDTEVAAIKAKTDNLPAAPAATGDVAALLTTQLTESYAADGVAPTLAQALMLIQQMLGDFSISGTTLTAKKLDGTTTAATFTLNSATAPTSITRAS